MATRAEHFANGDDAGRTACLTTGREGATAHREFRQAEHPASFWEGWSWALWDYEDANGLPHSDRHLMAPLRPLDSDKALEITLIATVNRDLHDGISREDSNELLRERAGGRSYLLAKAAGHYLGQFLAYGATCPDGGGVRGAAHRGGCGPRCGAGGSGSSAGEREIRWTLASRS